MLQAYSDTFREVIEKDTDFSELLGQIKKAYEDYM